MIKKSTPASRKFLAIIIMISLAIFYYHFNQPVKKHKIIKLEDVTTVTVVYKDLPSKEIKDKVKIKQIVETYNKAIREKGFTANMAPSETIFIQTKSNAEIYIATYNKNEVIVEYKDISTNVQYLAKSADLSKLLAEIK